jgi:cytoskeletal protein CcmA (bactofilin family)
MSNYTQLGLIKQTDGENEGTWGDKLNESLIDLLDDSIGGYVEVSVASGNVTLAFADGTADNNGRHAVIKFTGSPGTTRTVTFPDAQVNYFIINGSDGSVICTSGSGAATVTIPTGMKNIIYVDGSDEILSMFATPNISGNVTIGVDDTGYDVKMFGATSGSYLLWDESADSLLLTDSTPLKIGDTQDLTLYHDGSNSYITNAVGALKVATETSGIAVTIGHTTSETTIADNATVTGNLSVGGDFDVTGSFDMSDANITNIGSIALDTITNDGTDITLDSSGDIILDAAGDTIFLKDAGTTFGSLDNTSGNLIIKSGTTTAATFSGANVTLAGTVGSGAVTSTGVVTGTGFTIGSAVINEAELETIDGITAGTVIASKALVVDSNKDIATLRNITLSGELDAGSLDVSGDADIDGTLEADAITIGGTAITAGGASKGFAIAVAIAL